MSLTREQVKALKSASRIVFSHSNGEGTLRAIEETRKRDAEGRPVERDLEIVVESVVKGVGPETEGQPPLAEVACCFHMMWVSHGGDEGNYWRTVAGILRAGDVLSLKWGRGYDSNGNLEKSGLFKDRLSLYVQRGEKKLVFIMPTPVCKDNTSRTIRRGVFNMG